MFTNEINHKYKKDIYFSKKKKKKKKKNNYFNVVSFIASLMVNAALIVLQYLVPILSLSTILSWLQAFDSKLET